MYLLNLIQAIFGVIISKSRNEFTQPLIHQTWNVYVTNVKTEVGIVTIYLLSYTMF